MRDSVEPRGGGEADVFVLTALRVEFEAVLEQLGPELEFTVDREGAQYAEGVLEGLHGRVRVAVHLAGQGNEAAAAAVQRGVRRYEPAVVLMVGVAGGRKDVRLGDVVAADAVHGYERGRDELGGLVPRVMTWHSDFALVQQAQMTASLHNWRWRVPEGSRGEGAAEPRAFVGAIAAGAKVIADERSGAAQVVARTAGDSLAVEMEGLGFMVGAWPHTTVAPLVVRGISDLLSGKTADKDELWQPLAARHAAAFAFEVLARHLPAVRPEEARRHLAAGAAPLAPARTGHVPAPAPAPGGVRAQAKGAAAATAPVPAQARPAEPGPAPHLQPAPPTLSERVELAGLLLSIPALNSPAGWQRLFDAVPVLGRTTPRTEVLHDQALVLLQTAAATGTWRELAEAVGLLWPDLTVVPGLVGRLAARG